MTCKLKTVSMWLADVIQTKIWEEKETLVFAIGNLAVVDDLVLFRKNLIPTRTWQLLVSYLVFSKYRTEFDTVYV